MTCALVGEGNTSIVGRSLLLIPWNKFASLLLHRALWHRKRQKLLPLRHRLPRPLHRRQRKPLPQPHRKPAPLHPLLQQQSIRRVQNRLNRRMLNLPRRVQLLLLVVNDRRRRISTTNCHTAIKSGGLYSIRHTSTLKYASFHHHLTITCQSALREVLVSVPDAEWCCDVI